MVLALKEVMKTQEPTETDALFIVFVGQGTQKKMNQQLEGILCLSASHVNPVMCIHSFIRFTENSCACVTSLEAVGLQGQELDVRGPGRMTVQESCISVNATGNISLCKSLVPQNWSYIKPEYLKVSSQ